MSDPYAQPPPARPEPEPGAGWSAPPGYQPPQQRSTNGFAIAALVFGILGGVPLAVIFGIIALVQIPKRGQKGTGMAIAGLVLSAIWTLVIIAAVGLILAFEVERDSSGAITEGGSVTATSLEVGDCLNGLEESTAVSSLPAVPCGEPHEGEVFALFDLPDADYPAESEMVEQAETGCVERLAAYSQEAMDDPSIGLFYVYPLEQAWPQDREVVCIAIHTSGTMTGSIRD